MKTGSFFLHNDKIWPSRPSGHLRVIVTAIPLTCYPGTTVAVAAHQQHRTIFSFFSSCFSSLPHRPLATRETDRPPSGTGDGIYPSIGMGIIPSFAALLFPVKIRVFSRHKQSGTTRGVNFIPVVIWACFPRTLTRFLQGLDVNSTCQKRQKPVILAVLSPYPDTRLFSYTSKKNSLIDYAVSRAAARFEII